MILEQLENAVREKTGVTHKESKKNVLAVLEAIKEGIETHGKVQVKGFGVFKKVHQKERLGRNPQNGDPVTIPARTRIKFDSYM